MSEGEKRGKRGQRGGGRRVRKNGWGDGEGKGSKEIELEKGDGGGRGRG
jgi:hypothetical protein